MFDVSHHVAQEIQPELAQIGFIGPACLSGPDGSIHVAHFGAGPNFSKNPIPILGNGELDPPDSTLLLEMRQDMHRDFHTHQLQS